MLIGEGGGRRVYAIDGGRVRLDGGAMFGVVPKPLWSRRIPADERNRIPLAMRCLLVRTERQNVLVDTGLGNKEGEKFREIYGVENAGRPTRLEDSLREVGVQPEEVDIVVSTHLHFDHAGGNTLLTPGGELRPAFPNARYLIRRGEWEMARRDNERIRASYLPANYEPLGEHGVLELLEEDGPVAPGVSVLRTPGHTPHHQSVLVELGSETLCFLADLAPTAAHLPLSWIMGYDLEPLVTLETKRNVLSRAASEGWLLVFEHDPEIAVGRATPRSDGRDGCDLEVLGTVGAREE
ncbi:MAG: MBL fold metallo-hydrolase [Gemmatimonadota bacterium]